MKRNVFIKNRKELLQLLAFVVFAIGLPMLLFFVGSIKYPLRDPNDPAFLWVAIPAFGLAVGVQLLWRKRIFRPWRSQTLALWSVIILGIAISATFAVLGGFLIGNGVLDRGGTKREEFQILGQYEPPQLLLQPIGGHNQNPISLDVGKAYWNAGSGSVLVLEVGPGLFGRPWIAGRTVLHPSNRGAPLSSTDRPFPRRSSVSLVGTASIIILVFWASRRSNRKRVKA